MSGSASQQIHSGNSQKPRVLVGPFGSDGANPLLAGKIEGAVADHLKTYDRFEVARESTGWLECLNQNSSCWISKAQAAGFDKIVTGEVGYLDRSLFHLSLTLIDVATAQVEGEVGMDVTQPQLDSFVAAGQNLTNWLFRQPPQKNLEPPKNSPPSPPLTAAPALAPTPTPRWIKTEGDPSLAWATLSALMLGATGGATWFGVNELLAADQKDREADKLASEARQQSKPQPAQADKLYRQKEEHTAHGVVSLSVAGFSLLMTGLFLYWSRPREELQLVPGEVGGGPAANLVVSF